MLKNNNKFRLVLSYFILFVFTLLSLVILCHSWNMSQLNVKKVKEIYPNFSEFVIFIGNNSNILFVLLLILVLVCTILFLFKYTENKKISVFVILVTLLFLFLAEVILRVLGYYPGYYKHSRYFTPVQNLWEYKGFYTDENGIFKIDSVTGKIIAKRIKENIPSYKENEAGEVYSIVSDFLRLQSGEQKNPLADLYNRIKKKKIDQRSDLERSIIEYINSPVNSDGFKSIKFQSYNVDKPSVLLLGDSFTWGHSTTNKTNCFADILLSKGYVVYNTGITATDVTQYLTIAQKYIPKLKPDYVIANFYLGNDITYYKREVKPFTPLLYATNAGNLMAYPNGIPLSTKEDAYQSVKSIMSIPDKTIFFNLLMAQTSITSLSWGFFFNNNSLFPYLQTRKPENSLQQKERKFKTPYCNIELNEIKKLCTSHGSIFILSSIPEVYRYSKKYAKDFPHLFDGLNYKEMKVDESDYKLDDGHFNDKGHAKYAAFLDSLLTLKKL